MSSDKARQATCSRICQILGETRIKRDLSMTTLAQKTGLSQQAISYMEREMRIPNLDTLLRIANSLEVGLGDVINQASQEVSDKTTKQKNKGKGAQHE
jgi:transcriptional regulator with XRE-family HTH domain